MLRETGHSVFGNDGPSRKTSPMSYHVISLRASHRNQYNLPISSEFSLEKVWKPLALSDNLHDNVSKIVHFGSVETLWKKTSQRNMESSGTGTEKVVSSHGTRTTSTRTIIPIKRDDLNTRIRTGLKDVSPAPNNRDSDSDSDFEEKATDNLLGRLRNGMNLIQNFARETMAQCDSDETRTDMAERLEKSHLGMLRAEKSFLNTTRIIAEVVDEFASDFEDEVDEDEQGDAATNPKAITDGESIGNDDGLSDQVSSKKSVIPIVFRPTVANGLSIRNYGSKLSKMMKERLTNYEAGLTDDILRSEKKFLELQKQIQTGRQDSENNLGSVVMNLSDKGAGDMDDSTLCPMTNIRFESDDEEDDDETILPSTDPITMYPIHTAVRNKFCNHIFDKDSISEFIRMNPTSTCPMYGCRNEKPLNKDHFVEESKLTKKIRIKNSKLE